MLDRVSTVVAWHRQCNALVSDEDVPGQRGAERNDEGDPCRVDAAKLVELKASVGTGDATSRQIEDVIDAMVACLEGREGQEGGRAGEGPLDGMGIGIGMGMGEKTNTEERVGTTGHRTVTRRGPSSRRWSSVFSEARQRDVAEAIIELRNEVERLEEVSEEAVALCVELTDGLGMEQNAPEKEGNGQQLERLLSTTIELDEVLEGRGIVRRVVEVVCDVEKGMTDGEVDGVEGVLGVLRGSDHPGT